MSYGGWPSFFNGELMVYTPEIELLGGGRGGGGGGGVDGWRLR